MEKSTKKRVRNVVLGMTSVALVAGITASLTLAYLSDTQTKTNVFSNNPTITAKLTETKWNGDTTGTSDGTDDTYATDTNAKDIFESETATTADFGINQAKEYLPGVAINKNPVVTNTNQTESEYVAIKLTYYVDLDQNGTIDKATEEVTAEQFEKLATIDFNTTKWYKDTTNSNIWYYGGSLLLESLLKDEATAPLFTTVTPSKDLAYGKELVLQEEILPDTSQIAITPTKGTGLPKFEIDVKAAVISTSDDATHNQEGVTAQAKLLALLS